MSRRDDIKRIWRECFDDSAEYVDMYFDRVYREQDAMTLEAEGQTVSSMLLQSYTMHYLGSEVGMSYIAGAATRRQMRGRGYMSQLIKEGLMASRDRGDMLCSLIPAHEWLYYYYEHKGFSTVFYVDPQRYTSLHTFPVKGEYESVDDPYSVGVYEAFHRMEMSLPCCVLHNQRQFLNILDDLSLDGGHYVAVRNLSSGEIESMAWAVESDGMVVVKRLLGDSKDARTASLRQLREAYPGLPFKVLVPPLSEYRKLYPSGMARIVNVENCLQVAASHDKKLTLRVRVIDNELTENSHIYILKGGRCEIDDSYRGTLDLDVDHRVFTKIVFSSSEIGGIIGFPSVRPVMSLMLD